MSNSTVRNLIIIAVALSGLAWYASQRQQTSFAPTELGLFAPGLESRLADITRVEIQAAGKEPVVLEEAGDSRWIVPAKAGYDADLGKLRQTLRTLATVRNVEAKTANPDLHARLKLTPMSDAEDTTVEIRAFADAEPVVAVLLGRTGQGGMYARHVEDKQTWLIGEAIQPGREAGDWLDKALVDIKRADLRRVAVTPVDGTPWSLQRPTADTTDFTLDPAPPEERDANGANINRLLSTLANLRLLDVRNATDADTDTAWRTVRFESTSGMVVTARARAGEGGDYELMLDATAPPVDSAEAADDADAARTVAARVESLRKRTAGRVFTIPSYPGVGMLLDYEAMLQALPEDTADE